MRTANYAHLQPDRSVFFNAIHSYLSLAHPRYGGRSIDERGMTPAQVSDTHDLVTRTMPPAIDRRAVSFPDWLAPLRYAVALSNRARGPIGVKKRHAGRINQLRRAA